jgi:EAL domain-containing protein (putative c-di-GMP-specific phosphodiesterase class I)
VDGVEVLRFLAGQSCQAQILLVSGMDHKVIGTAMQLGKARGLNMLGILQKPIQLADLEDMLAAAGREARAIGEPDLKQAIEDGQLLAHYQPLMDLKSRSGATIRSVEVLARWQHPERKLIMPDVFIPLAEECNLIAPLTDVVLRLSLRQAARWRESGTPVSVAVNMAPQLLADLEFPDQLSALLTAYGVDASSLVLEVTERAAMGEASRTMDVLTRLRLKGVGLSIDDFGTGYSSLVDLYRLPYNQVKIDKSFVQDLDQPDNAEEAKVIIRSIIDLAHNLGLEVCAEGVESEASLGFLRSLGCDKAQGYCISRPLPPERIDEVLAGPAPPPRAAARATPCPPARRPAKGLVSADDR